MDFEAMKQIEMCQYLVRKTESLSLGLFLHLYILLLHMFFHNYIQLDL